MKLFPILALAFLSSEVFAQTCQVQMVDNYQRIVKVFSAYGDPSNCVEGMKQCRKAIRLEPHLGGVDCIRSSDLPLPDPQPSPDPQPQPLPGRIPDEILRMNELQQAINFVLENCYVKPNVDGWANQLYINGKFSGNFQVGQQDQQLRRTIHDYQARGLCLMKHPSILNIQFSPYLIDSAVDGTLSRNCSVRPNVDGWANQLYLDGVFSGNFDARSPFEQMKLKATLATHLSSGRCLGRSQMELNLLRDPRLISDFANFQYRGCHVKLNVDGWANQIFVGNQFKGNFHKQTELHKLQISLVNLIINGTCIYDPI